MAPRNPQPGRRIDMKFYLTDIEIVDNGCGNEPIKLDTTVTPTRENAGFFVSRRLGVGVPPNKALPNKGSRSSVLLIAPMPFLLEKTANSIEPLSKETLQMSKQLSIPTIHDDLVSDDLTTTSLIIAKKFKKQHKDVLRAIENLEVPAEWLERNFALKQNIVPISNGATRTTPYYEITRDGFVILVMGFTGKTAMGWKLKFLDAFNRMEAALRGGQQLQLDHPSTKDDRQPLTNLVNSLVSVAPIAYRDAWHMVKAELKTTKKAAEFTVSEAQTAMAFVQSKIDLYCASPEVDFITRQALAGTTAFCARLTVEQPVNDHIKAVKREFRANIYITEEKPQHEVSSYLKAASEAFHQRQQRTGIR